MALSNEMKRQTLLGNIANNLIAFGNRTPAVAPATALMDADTKQRAMKSLTLRDVLAMRQEERLKMNSEMAAAAQQRAQQRAEQAQGILSQGGNSRVSQLAEAGFLDEAGKLKDILASSDKYDVQEIKTGDKIETWLTLNGKPIKKLAIGDKKSGQTINIGEGPFKKANEDFLTDLRSRRNDALSTQKSYSSILEAGKILDEGNLITGAGADWRLGFAKAANLLGANNDELISNTETYGRSMGRQTAEIIKAFGSGTGLSDKDREYAEGIAGGSIGLNKKSMKRLVELAKKYYKIGIDQYNADVTRLRDRGVGDSILMDLSNLEMPVLQENPMEQTINDLLEKYK